jgi:hypothetical protein
MKRLAITVALVFVVVCGLALIFWAFVPAQNDAAGKQSKKTVADGFEASSKSWSFSTDATSINMNGKITSFALPGQDAKEVEVKLANHGTISIRDGRVNAIFEVTFKSEQPVELTKGAYDKVQSGMTFPQIGEVFGGVLTSGQMSDGFSSKLALRQGRRRIDLTFIDGKVTEKSAQGVE